MSEIINQCEICFQDGMLQVAVIYCLDCKHPLCESCSKNHSKFRSMKGHKLLTVEEYANMPETVRNFNEFCEIHSEEQRLYVCSEHNKNICFACLKEEHKECMNIVKITEDKVKVEIQEISEELRAQIESAERIVDSLIKSYSINMKDLQMSGKSAQTEIKGLISKLHSCLDKYRKQVEDNISEECVKLQQKLTKCEDLQKTLSVRKSQFNDFVQYGTDLQLFIKLSEFRQEQTEYDKFIASIDSDKDKTKFVFELVPPAFDKIVRMSVRKI